MNVPPAEQITVHLRVRDEGTRRKIEAGRTAVTTLARVKDLSVAEEGTKPAHAAYTHVRGVEVFVPMDRSRMEEEAVRLRKEIGKIEKEITFVGKKLANEQFVARAPREVVDEEREKARRYETHGVKLKESLQRIEEALQQ
jgi:valyl-tRNA synthetase